MNGAGVVALTTPGVKLPVKFTFLDVQRQVLDVVMRDGEALVFIHEGRSNPHGIQLELLSADRLDIEKNELLQNGNVMRMGIEMEKRTRKPIAYWLNLSEGPLYGSYTFSPLIGSKFERVGAEKIIHVY